MDKINNAFKRLFSLRFGLWILPIAYLLSGSGGKSSSSKDELSDEPWKDLGVSKQEYMDVYNKLKYGL